MKDQIEELLEHNGLVDILDEMAAYCAESFNFTKSFKDEKISARYRHAMIALNRLAIELTEMKA